MSEFGNVVDHSASKKSVFNLQFNYSLRTYLLIIISNNQSVFIAFLLLLFRFIFMFTSKLGYRLDQANEARDSYVTLSPQQPFSHTESSKTQFISPVLCK